MPMLNNPSLWLPAFFRPQADTHKYDRGCAVIFGGEAMTGAARLAACACARVGAGVTIVVAPTKEAGMIYRSALPGHIIVEDLKRVEDHLADPRRKAALIGPGGGDVKKRVLAILKNKTPCVLDADALTVFEGDAQTLLDHLHPSCVLTPHEGEFKRLFPTIHSTMTGKAEAAAAKAGCTVLVKGHDSAIACGGEETLTHEDLPAPYLATAGSGDVLAGMIAGLMAQGMSPYLAAAAAVYMHRMAGRMFGPGLVASDLPDMIPYVFKELGV